MQTFPAHVGREHVYPIMSEKVHKHEGGMDHRNNVCLLLEVYSGVAMGNKFDKI